MRSRHDRSAKPASCAARSATRARSRPAASATSASLRAWRAPSRRSVASRQLAPACVDLAIDARPASRARVASSRTSDRELLGDLGAAPLRGLGRLPQLHQLQLEIVAAPLLRRQGHAFGVVLLLARLEIVFPPRRARVAASAVSARATS